MARKEQTEQEEVKVATGAEEVTPVITEGNKKVKIQISEPVDCIISGKEYKCAVGKAYNVPQDVAAILCNAKKAYRV